MALTGVFGGWADRGVRGPGVGLVGGSLAEPGLNGLISGALVLVPGLTVGLSPLKVNFPWVGLVGLWAVRVIPGSLLSLLFTGVVDICDTSFTFWIGLVILGVIFEDFTLS